MSDYQKWYGIIEVALYPNEDLDEPIALTQDLVDEAYNKRRKQFFDQLIVDEYFVSEQLDDIRKGGGEIDIQALKSAQKDEWVQVRLGLLYVQYMNLITKARDYFYHHFKSDESH